MARSAMPVTSDASDTTRAATSETTSRSPLPVTEETPISLAVKSASKELDVFTVVPTTLEFCACSVPVPVFVHIMIQDMYRLHMG